MRYDLGRSDRVTQLGWCFAHADVHATIVERLPKCSRATGIYSNLTAPSLAVRISAVNSLIMNVAWVQGPAAQVALNSFLGPLSGEVDMEENGSVELTAPILA